MMLDVLIIGSGPAGLSASIYAKRANLSVCIAEKEYLGTGQIAESSRVDNYIGLAGETGYDLGERFRADAERFGVDFYEGEAVSVAREDGNWRTWFDNGEILESRTVIYAAGAAHRHLDLPEEQQYIGKGISFCAVCDGAFYNGKNVAVIGGGDTALDDALYLSELAGRVYLIHRREVFRGSGKTLSAIQAKENVEIITPAQVTAVKGDGRVSGIVINDSREIPVDGIFTAIGMLPRTQILRGLIDLDDNGYVVADETGVTNQPGFFAAGDIRTKKLRQVVTAVSDGANAAVSAAAYIQLL